MKFEICVSIKKTLTLLKMQSFNLLEIDGRISRELKDDRINLGFYIGQTREILDEYRSIVERYRRVANRYSSEFILALPLPRECQNCGNDIFEKSEDGCYDVCLKCSVMKESRSTVHSYDSAKACKMKPPNQYKRIERFELYLDNDYKLEWDVKDELMKDFRAFEEKFKEKRFTDPKLKDRKNFLNLRFVATRLLKRRGVSCKLYEMSNKKSNALYEKIFDEIFY